MEFLKLVSWDYVNKMSRYMKTLLSLVFFFYMRASMCLNITLIDLHLAIAYKDILAYISVKLGTLG